MNILRRTLLAGAAALLASTAIASAETYKIGVFNALTGPYAFGGVPIQNAMKQAIEEANASGELGDVKLEIVEADSASDKGQTITLVSKFAQADNVLMILGPTTSLEASGGAPVANELKVPMFVIGSSTATLDAGPWSFKVQSVGGDIMGSLVDYTVEKLGAKKIALVFDRANDGFVGQKDAFKKGLEAAGVEIVSEDGILSSDTDFLALGTKLAASDIDAFFVAAPTEVGGNFVLQARQAGVPMDVAFVGPSTFATQSLIDTAGGAAEGAIILSDYFVGTPGERNENFVKNYEARYSRAPDNWAAMGYALGQIAVEAIKKAGPEPTREKVRDALENIGEVPTIIGNGTWSMKEGRHPIYGAAILTVKDGAFTLAP